jgi:predicted dehydrogenase
MNPLDLRVDVADAISVRFRAQSGSPAVGIIGSTGNLGIGDGGMCELQVCCSRGRLTLEHIGGTLTVRHHDGREERYEIPESERYPMFATGNNLVDVVLGRGANESPAEVGVRTVELLDAAYRSAAADGAVVKIEDL